MILKLDYDCSKTEMLSRFRTGLISLKRVQDSKMNDEIKIVIKSVHCTAHGFHVILDYFDDIFKYQDHYFSKLMDNAGMQFGLINTNRLCTIIIQSMFGSDITRSFFDMRRVIRREKYFNLLFNYKNGRQFVDDFETKAEIEELISEVMKGK